MTMEKKVDDDWKRRAEREKEAMDGKLREEAMRRTPPRASFGALVSSFATQAVLAFGDVEHPVTRRKERDLDAARYAIDMLAVIEEKTRGNLSEAETEALQSMIRDLRLRYVSEVEAEGTGGSGSTIVTPGEDDAGGA